MASIHDSNNSDDYSNGNQRFTEDISNEVEEDIDPFEDFKRKDI